ncbi:hypothetical protein [Paenarthrobacter sp. PH39-S1]|uniref:hypothetical protein n=1 Tax=Paenarthrobacter sp. PH39-S1 TaxID=3046204 RepID=UPI0024B9EA53|nr:hypothetical protein [Paenarthrobacter sp. PH39-S1]MDJ0358113.1 hypothetical protein [Paenarthrobacter sp. PH39-S1]
MAGLPAACGGCDHFPCGHRPGLYGRSRWAWAGWITNKKLFATIIIGNVLRLIFELAGDPKLKPALDFKAGTNSVLPWSVAMALVS